MYLISVYVPQANKEEVKNAMFKAGGGRFKNYDCCSFELKGTGQFRPLNTSNPHIGEHEKIQVLEEYRVEMICEEKYLDDVVVAMKKTHPYEEVAYNVIKLKN